MKTVQTNQNKKTFPNPCIANKIASKIKFEVKVIKLKIFKVSSKTLWFCTNISLTLILFKQISRGTNKDELYVPLHETRIL